MEKSSTSQNVARNMTSLSLILISNFDFDALLIEFSKQPSEVVKRKPSKPPKTKKQKTHTHVVEQHRWSPAEDEELRLLVIKYGHEDRWKLIAKSMSSNRKSKQCRERWTNHLQPNIDKNKNWSEAEEQIIVDCHALNGNCWSEMATKLPTRTAMAIKNHWNIAYRKAERGSTKKEVSNSLLLNYCLNLVQVPSRKRKRDSDDD